MVVLEVHRVFGVATSSVCAERESEDPDGCRSTAWLGGRVDQAPKGRREAGEGWALASRRGVDLALEHTIVVLLLCCYGMK